MQLLNQKLRVKFSIPKDYIGAIIGPGGKNIQALQADTETTIVITEVGDFGEIELLGTNQAGMDKAFASIQNQVFAPVEGETYKVKVTKVLDFGAVVEFVPRKRQFTTRF
jgi:polyribonucleotide nucleotidyltransferase